jgi:hypothetical protein
MEKQKKWVLFGLVILLVSVFSFCQAAEEIDLGQEAPELVATVNIFNAKIVSQEGNKLKIGFDLTNRQGNQPNVRYGIELFSKKGEQELADRKVFEEKLILGENESLPKEVVYEAPAYLAGDFSVFVLSYNDKDLPLGIAQAGVVTLSGDGKYVFVNQTDCFLTVEGDEKKYDLNQGVDVDSNEKLSLVCKLENKTGRDVTVVPSLATFGRSVFGNFVREDSLTPIVLKSKETKELTLVVPKIEKPQAYDAVLLLRDEKKAVLSSYLKFHYVVRGASGTIQNTTLDKDYYQKGEVASVSVFWTESADQFFGSRKQGSSPEQLSVRVGIKNLQGQSCAESFSQKVSLNSRDSILNLKIPITRECQDPEVIVSLMSGNSELDSTTFQVKSKKAPSALQEQLVSRQKMGKGLAMGIMLGAIVSLVMLVTILVKRKNSGTLVIILSAILLSGLFLALSGTPAKADTFTVYPFTCGSCNPSVYLNSTKAVYAVNPDQGARYLPGSTMTLWGIIKTLSTCGNGSAFGRVEGRVNGNTSIITHGTTNVVGVPRPAQFTVESVPGNYTAKLIGHTYGSRQKCWLINNGTKIDCLVYDENGNGIHGFGRANANNPYLLPYTVYENGVCGSASGQAFPDPPTTNLCSKGDASSVRDAGPVWAWTCTGAFGGEVTCIADKLVVNGICGSANGGTFATAPRVNLCSAGTASVVTDTGLGWAWTCVGSGVTSNCSANKLISTTINVSIAGTGAGTVTGTSFNDAAEVDPVVVINCDGVAGQQGQVTTSVSTSSGRDDCSETITAGGVALAPVAQEGSVFAGWSGACLGSGNCSILATGGVKNVTATFNLDSCSDHGECVCKRWSACTGTCPDSPNGIEVGEECSDACGKNCSNQRTCTRNCPVDPGSDDNWTEVK